MEGPATSTTSFRQKAVREFKEMAAPILSEFGKQGLERSLEAEAFARREVSREDDLLDFPVGCLVDIKVARQPLA